MQLPRITSPEEWQRAREELLVKEEATRARDTSLVFVSAAPVADIERFRQRMGWGHPLVPDDRRLLRRLRRARDVGLNVFLRDGDRVFRTYFTTGRGVETLGSAFTLLDPPYSRWRLHDEYGRFEHDPDVS